MGAIIREDKSLITLSDVGKGVASYIFLIFIRYIAVFLFYPCLSRMGYGFTIPQAILVSYGGLRGAVGLALAIVVHDDSRLPKKV